MSPVTREYIRSLQWADYLYYALVEPRRLMRMILREGANPLWGGLAIAFAAVMIDVITLSLLKSETAFFYYRLTYGSILFFIFFLIRVLVLATLIDLACQFAGYPGSVKHISSLVCYSVFPQVFVLPLVYVFKVTHLAAPFFYVFFSFGLAVWSALIIIQGISEIHSIPFSRAALLFLFPFALVGVLAFFSMVLAGMLAYGYLSFL